MNIKNLLRTIALGIAVITTSCGTNTPKKSGDVPLLVVTSGLKMNTLSLDDLKRIYLGRTTKWNGQMMTLTVPDHESEEMEKVLSVIYSRSLQAYFSFWSGKVFRGKGLQPVELTTAEETVEFLIKNPNAIGFLKPTEITKGIKIIRIEGDPLM